MNKRSPRWAKMKVSADGTGVASHSGCELLRELATASGLVAAWDQALIGTYSGLPFHFPGQVLADLAVSIADGATSISGMRALRDQPSLFGPVPSGPTAWRVLDKVSEEHLGLLRAGRAKARAAAWEAGAAPDLSQELVLDLDATIVVAHSEKEGAARLEAHLRFPPALLFLGPARCLLGRSAGRAAAAGQRRCQHRRRPHSGARHGDRGCPRCPPRHRGRAAPACPGSFRSCYARVCCRLPAKRGRLQLRLPGDRRG